MAEELESAPGSAAVEERKERASKKRTQYYYSKQRPGVADIDPKVKFLSRNLYRFKNHLLLFQAVLQEKWL